MFLVKFGSKLFGLKETPTPAVDVFRNKPYPSSETVKFNFLGFMDPEILGSKLATFTILHRKRENENSLKSRGVYNGLMVIFTAGRGKKT